MMDFASSTGLLGAAPLPKRYLWTDAFAVCNFLQLYKQTGEDHFLRLALKLIDRVHEVLGHHRPDSDQSGWLSGLPDQMAREHPTCAGLRIGKKFDERAASEPVNDSLEWEQDGQYYHYLTKWMHALNCVSKLTGDHLYNHWALELAKVAHAAFVVRNQAGEATAMVWKMSIDLSRPLVQSMGQHDPLDGLITYQQLHATARQFNNTPPALNLNAESKELYLISTNQSWATQDTLGIGGLLTEAYRLARLICDEKQTAATWKHALLEQLLNDIHQSMDMFFSHNTLNLPANYRLAFRELGLSIGMHAVSRMETIIRQHPAYFEDRGQLLPLLANLDHYHPIADQIESYWLDSSHRADPSWQDHADINTVMLATSLSPDGYLSAT